MPSFIIGVEELGDVLIQETYSFCMKHSLLPEVLYVDGCSIKAEPIIRALITDLVEANLAWGESNADSHHAAMKTIAPWFEYDSTNALSEAYFQEVYDPFFCLLEGIIHAMVPNKTWFLWSVTFRPGVVIVDQGRDYRVIQWEIMTGYKKETPKPKRPKAAVKQTPYQYRAPYSTIPPRHSIFQEEIRAGLVRKTAFDEDIITVGFAE